MDLGTGRVIYLNGSMKPTFDGLTVRNVTASNLVNFEESKIKNIVWVGTPVYETYTGDDCICQQDDDTAIQEVKYIGKDYIISTADGEVEISGLEGGEQLAVYTVLGAQVTARKAVFETETFSNIPAGVYVVKVGNAAVKTIVE